MTSGLYIKFRNVLFAVALFPVVVKYILKRRNRKKLMRKVFFLS